MSNPPYNFMNYLPADMIGLLFYIFSPALSSLLRNFVNYVLHSVLFIYAAPV